VSTPDHLRAAARLKVLAPVLALVLAASGAGCDPGPHTAVILSNGYPPPATAPLVVYRAYWQNVSFPTPVDPGFSSAPQSAESTSGDTAYVVLAPGWDPELSARPKSLVVMQSRTTISVSDNDLLTLTVNDTTFAGNCVAGSLLPQAQADFITRVVFPCDFASFHYDAATCTLTPVADGGAACDGGGP
jgi:hypothetical protein